MKAKCAQNGDSGYSILEAGGRWTDDGGQRTIVVVIKGLIIKVLVITADIRGNRARYWNGGKDWFVERG